MSILAQDHLQKLVGAEEIGKFANSELVCQIYDNLYGLPIRSVQEILPLPHILKLPQLPDSILGVCLFRDDIIPVLDLTPQLQLSGDQPEAETWQMVVISHHDRLCALAVRDIVEIINYESTDIEPLPSTTEGEEYFFRGIKGTELGMVTLLNMDAVVEHCHLPSRQQTGQAAQTVAQADNKIISLIAMGSQRVAIEIDEIERILRTPKIYPVKDAADYIKGKSLHPDKDTINPQPEDYFPVIDMFDVLGMKQDASNLGNLILLKDSTQTVGYYTGVVEEIRDVGSDDISKVPALVITDHNQYVSGILNLEDELILLINLSRVLNVCDLKLV